MELESLGLTRNEEKAYEIILRLGKAGAAQISKESSVPYGRIYTVLDSLEEKNLIKIIPESTKKFVPTDPEKLHEMIAAKIKTLEEVENKIKKYKSIYDEHGTEPIQVVRGKSNFIKIIRELKKPQIYNYAIKYNFDLSPEIVRMVKEGKAKGVKKKTLGRLDKETEKNVAVWKKIDTSIKPIENEGVAMAIIDDEEMFISLIKSNATMLIKDKPFIKIMRQLYDAYYENSERDN